MSIDLKNDPVPLQMDEDGVIRVGRTRVTLDSVIAAFNAGATAEQIAQDYSSLDLADVYAVIGYYLRHGVEVESYLRRQEQDAEQIRQQMESQFDPRGIRARLLTRRAGRDEHDASADNA